MAIRELTMSADAGGWMWFTIDVALVSVLGIAVAYATMMWRHRHQDPTIQRARNQATRSHYRAK